MRMLPLIGFAIALAGTLIGPCYVCLDATLPMWTGMVLFGLGMAFVSAMFLAAPEGTERRVMRGRHAYGVHVH